MKDNEMLFGSFNIKCSKIPGIRENTIYIYTQGYDLNIYVWVSSLPMNCQQKFKNVKDILHKRKSHYFDILPGLSA